MDPPQRKMQEAEKIAPLPLDPVCECRANGRAFAPFRPRRTGLKELLHRQFITIPTEKEEDFDLLRLTPAYWKRALSTNNRTINILEEVSHA